MFRPVVTVSRLRGSCADTTDMPVTRGGRSQREMRGAVRAGGVDHRSPGGVRGRPRSAYAGGGGHAASAPGRTRTCDLEIRRLLLYPAELQGRGEHSSRDIPQDDTGVVHPLADPRRGVCLTTTWSPRTGDAAGRRGVAALCARCLTQTGLDHTATRFTAMRPCCACARSRRIHPPHPLIWHPGPRPGRVHPRRLRVVRGPRRVREDAGAPSPRVRARAALRCR